MTLTRRRFLQLGAVATAGMAALGSCGYWWRRSPRRYLLSRRSVGDHLRERFAYLRPDPAEVDRFVALYFEHHNARPTRGTLPHVEEVFLMSTDFFQSGQPANGPVRFVTLYHPYAFPCYNPMVQVS